MCRISSRNRSCAGLCYVSFTQRQTFPQCLHQKRSRWRPRWSNFFSGVHAIFFLEKLQNSSSPCMTDYTPGLLWTTTAIASLGSLIGSPVLSGTRHLLVMALASSLKSCQTPHHQTDSPRQTCITETGWFARLRYHMYNKKQLHFHQR